MVVQRDPDLVGWWWSSPGLGGRGMLYNLAHRHHFARTHRCKSSGIHQVPCLVREKSWDTMRDLQQQRVRRRRTEGTTILKSWFILSLCLKMKKFSTAEIFKYLYNSWYNLSQLFFRDRNENWIIFQFQTPRMYCAANSDDLSEVIEYVKTIYPHVPLGATGISMGG